MRHAFVLGAAFFVLGLAPAAGSGLAIPMDEARIVKFSKPVATVFVANPMIADINSIDSTHAFILGKAFGQTNLIALDAQGNEIESQHVVVLGSNDLVTLNRGSSQFTFACATSRCETASKPGDLQPWHDQDFSEIVAHEDFGAKQATPNPGK